MLAANDSAKAARLAASSLCPGAGVTTGGGGAPAQARRRAPARVAGSRAVHSEARQASQPSRPVDRSACHVHPPFFLAQLALPNATCVARLVCVEVERWPGESDGPPMDSTRGRGEWTSAGTAAGPPGTPRMPRPRLHADRTPAECYRAPPRRRSSDLPVNTQGVKGAVPRVT